MIQSHLQHLDFDPARLRLGTPYYGIALWASTKCDLKISTHYDLVDRTDEYNLHAKPARPRATFVLSGYGTETCGGGYKVYLRKKVLRIHVAYDRCSDHACCAAAVT
jgi:hypothetical protein